MSQLTNQKPPCYQPFCNWARVIQNVGYLISKLKPIANLMTSFNDFRITWLNATKSEITQICHTLALFLSSESGVIFLLSVYYLWNYPQIINGKALDSMRWSALYKNKCLSKRECTDMSFLLGCTAQRHHSMRNSLYFMIPEKMIMDPSDP